MKHIIRSRVGLSLFEIVLTIGMAATLVTVAIRFGVALSNLGALIGHQTQAIGNVNLGFQVMITDIRSIGPSSLGSYAIESAATSSFIFYSDVDQDGIFDRVRYFFGTSTLNRGVVKPVGSPLVYSTSSEIIVTAIPNVIVKSSTIDYFDTNYTGTQSPLTSPIDPLAVRVVRPTIVADVSTSTGPKPVTVSQTITIRNLRSN
jgi:hypothetical protein